MKKRFPFGLTAVLLLAVALSGCGPTEYTLNITVEGQGFVTPASGARYPAGTVVGLTATGAPGYALDHWGGTDGAAVAANEITMNGDKHLVAVFVKLERNLNVEVSPAGAGLVDTVLVLQPRAAYSVGDGQTVRLTYQTNYGYQFDHWMVNGAAAGGDNPFLVAMDGDKDVTAVFTLLHFGLGVNASEPSWGYVDTDPVQPAEGFEYGQTVQVTAHPNVGCAFVRWEGDLTGTANPATVAIDGPKAVTAVFHHYTWQIASNGKAKDYTTHWNDEFYYPDQFKQDGSDTGFPWSGFGSGVFCILNPLIDYPNDEIVTGLATWSEVQVWVVKAADFAIGPDGRCDLQGKDVSDALGRPDLVWVQVTASAGAGSILVWPAPLTDRRAGAAPIVEGEEFILLIELPDAEGHFDNVFDSGTDYIDGVWEAGGAGLRGFSVINITN